MPKTKLNSPGGTPESISVVDGGPRPMAVLACTVMM